MRQRFPGLFDTVEFSPGSLKKWDRSVVKLLGEEGNIADPTKGEEVVDLVRGRIVIDNADQVRAVREILSDEALRQELGIEYAKDRFAVPSATHYRDINMSIRLPNGHIAEVQINQRDMLAAAEFTHDPYEDADAMEKRTQIEGTQMTPDQRLEQTRLTTYAQDVHDLGAARFKGADELLSDMGRDRLARDHAARLAIDPAYVPGQTIQTGHKYDAVLVDGVPPTELSKDAYGGVGAKALHAQAGIQVDGIEATKLDLSQIREPHVAPNAGISLMEEFGKRSGMIGGTIVAGALYASDADASEIAAGTAEAVVPGVSSAMALHEGRLAEAAMRGVEEIPVAGIIASEIARPILRGGGFDLDPSIGQMLLSIKAEVDPDQQRFMRVLDGIPDMPADDMPPEVSSLVELKRAVLQSERKLTLAGDPQGRLDAARDLDAVQARYSEQYDELAKSGSLSEVESWIAGQNAGSTMQPLPTPPRDVGLTARPAPLRPAPAPF